MNSKALRIMLCNKTKRIKKLCEFFLPANKPAKDPGKFHHSKIFKIKQSSITMKSVPHYWAEDSFKPFRSSASLAIPLSSHTCSRVCQ